MNALSFTELHKKHIATVDELNKEQNPALKAIMRACLQSWLEGLQDAGVNTGALLIAADNVQLERGETRPMVGGVFI